MHTPLFSPRALFTYCVFCFCFYFFKAGRGHSAYQASLPWRVALRLSPGEWHQLPAQTPTVSANYILHTIYERGQGNVHFPCSADHE